MFLFSSPFSILCIITLLSQQFSGQYIQGHGDTTIRFISWAMYNQHNPELACWIDANKLPTLPRNPICCGFSIAKNLQLWTFNGVFDECCLFYLIVGWNILDVVGWKVLHVVRWNVLTQENIERIPFPWKKYLALTFLTQLLLCDTHLHNHNQFLKAPFAFFLSIIL